MSGVLQPGFVVHFGLLHFWDIHHVPQHGRFATFHDGGRCVRIDRQCATGMKETSVARTHTVRQCATLVCVVARPFVKS